MCVLFRDPVDAIEAHVSEADTLDPWLKTKLLRILTEWCDFDYGGSTQLQFQLYLSRETAVLAGLLWRIIVNRLEMGRLAIFISL